MITIKNELKGIFDKGAKIELAKKLNKGIKSKLDPERFKVLTKIIDGHIAIGIQDKDYKVGEGDLIDLWNELSNSLRKFGFVQGDDYDIDIKKNLLAIDFYPFIEG